MADVYISRFANVKNPIRITPQDIKRTALKLTTGNIHKDRIDINILREKLSVIKGQEDVIECIIDCIKRDSLELFPKTKPLTLLFAGSSGAGKTKTARIISRELTGSFPIMLNMTEFTQESSINRITGSHVGYIGSDSKAELPFDVLESNPRQVILLDELEKSHRVIQRLFMGAFDNGFIQLANGRTVDFSRTIIIATTNAGFNSVQESIGFTSNNIKTTSSVNDLSHCFDIELLNRFTKILYFNPISEQLFREIIKSRYEREVNEIKSRGKVGVDLPDTLSEDELDRLVTENYDPAFGARHVSQIVRAYIEDTLLDHNIIDI